MLWFLIHLIWRHKYAIDTVKSIYQEINVISWIWLIELLHILFLGRKFIIQMPESLDFDSLWHLVRNSWGRVSPSSIFSTNPNRGPTKEIKWNRRHWIFSYLLKLDYSFHSPENPCLAMSVLKALNLLKQEYSPPPILSSSLVRIFLVNPAVYASRR